MGELQGTGVVRAAWHWGVTYKVVGLIGSASEAAAGLLLMAEIEKPAAAASCSLIRVASTLSTRVGASKGSQHRRRAAGLMGGWAAGEGRHAVGDSESARGGFCQQEVGFKSYCRVLFHPRSLPLPLPPPGSCRLGCQNAQAKLSLFPRAAQTGLTRAGQNKTTKESVRTQ